MMLFVLLVTQEIVMHREARFCQTQSRRFKVAEVPSEAAKTCYIKSSKFLGECFWRTEWECGTLCRKYEGHLNGECGWKKQCLCKSTNKSKPPEDELSPPVDELNPPEHIPSSSSDVDD
ncbi:hypothetical protein U1Q18_023842 [Sarracenia purpurea var. burkii]